MFIAECVRDTPQRTLDVFARDQDGACPPQRLGNFRVGRSSDQVDVQIALQAVQRFRVMTCERRVEAGQHGVQYPGRHMTGAGRDCVRFEQFSQLVKVAEPLGVEAHHAPQGSLAPFNYAVPLGHHQQFANALAADVQRPSKRELVHAVSALGCVQDQVALEPVVKRLATLRLCIWGKVGQSQCRLFRAEGLATAAANDEAAPSRPCNAAVCLEHREGLTYRGPTDRKIGRDRAFEQDRARLNPALVDGREEPSGDQLIGGLPDPVTMRHVR